jgi:hypothetical protein
VQLLTLAAASLLIVVAVIMFLLDMIGRAEIVEMRWPKVWGIITSRPLILLFLVASLALLDRDFKDAMAIAPAPVVRMATPPAPVLGTSTSSEAECEKHRNEMADLINSGVALRDRLSPGDPAIPAGVKSDWNGWETMVVRTLDSADAATFKSYSVPGYPAQSVMMSQIGALEEFAKRLSCR